MKTAAVTASGAVGQAGSLGGWSVRATAAAVIRLRKDGVVTGEIVHERSLALDEQDLVSLGGDRLSMGDAGTYFELVSGTVVGSLWFD